MSAIGVTGVANEKRIRALLASLHRGNRVVVPGPLGDREVEWTSEFGGLLTIYGTGGTGEVPERTMLMPRRKLSVWVGDCVRNAR